MLADLVLLKAMDALVNDQDVQILIVIRMAQEHVSCLSQPESSSPAVFHDAELYKSCLIRWSQVSI